ncbi:hypothetical protein L3V83_09425 [Thiotrichales bacterium 19X7-9]|nr:hypothetical protein [Thiotrichales bacterium 19X7-9]
MLWSNIICPASNFNVVNSNSSFDKIKNKLGYGHKRVLQYLANKSDYTVINDYINRCLNKNLDEIEQARKISYENAYYNKKPIVGIKGENYQGNDKVLTICFPGNAETTRPGEDISAPMAEDIEGKDFYTISYVGTKSHSEALNRSVNFINEKIKNGNYDKIQIMGMSLGGNLAAHAAKKIAETYGKDKIITVSTSSSPRSSFDFINGKIGDKIPKCFSTNTINNSLPKAPSESQLKKVGVDECMTITRIHDEIVPYSGQINYSNNKNVNTNDHMSSVCNKFDSSIGNNYENLDKIEIINDENNYENLIENSQNEINKIDISTKEGHQFRHYSQTNLNFLKNEYKQCQNSIDMKHQIESQIDSLKTAICSVNDEVKNKDGNFNPQESQAIKNLEKYENSVKYDSSSWGKHKAKYVIGFLATGVGTLFGSTVLGATIGAVTGASSTAATGPGAIVGTAVGAAIGAVAGFTVGSIATGSMIKNIFYDASVNDNKELSHLTGYYGSKHLTA